ncbi:MAG TPA: N-acyl homoserine lactonase family protein [Candidatus Cybelea sp.]|nr:N-acyl homoserine lactonase family protein [Candidatus Cybelea sp.]
MQPYKIFAVKYAHHADRPASLNFINPDPHETGSPLDYFVWAIVGPDRAFVVDTGFNSETAQRRKRQHLRSPAAGLKQIGVDAAKVQDVIITHMHYDHAGTYDDFPNARFHLQDKEMQFVTGRCMCHGPFRHSFEEEHVVGMVRKVFAGRVCFHDGAEELAPGLSIHYVGGHTMGLQIVRVWTERGWVVIASDAAHLYANIDDVRPFPIVYHMGEMLEGYQTIRKLAASPHHIVPGHDPLVMRRYPAAERGLEDVAVRLDVAPRS